MDLATIQAIFSVLESVVSFLIKYGPGMIVDVENIVADLKLAWISATSGAALTADQQVQIRTALDNADSALQAAIAKAEAQDAADSVSS